MYILQYVRWTDTPLQDTLEVHAYHPAEVSPKENLYLCMVLSLEGDRAGE